MVNQHVTAPIFLSSPIPKSEITQASNQVITFARFFKLFRLAHEIEPVSKLCPRCVHTLAGIVLSAKMLTFALKPTYRLKRPNQILYRLGRKP